MEIGLDKIVCITLDLLETITVYPPPPPRRDFTTNWCKRAFFHRKKNIYRHIIVNYSQNHGDMKEIGLDKIVGITLELLKPETVCQPPAEILR